MKSVIANKNKQPVSIQSRKTRNISSQNKISDHFIDPRMEISSTNTLLLKLPEKQRVYQLHNFACSLYSLLLLSINHDCVFATSTDDEWNSKSSELAD